MKKIISVCLAIILLASPQITRADQSSIDAVQEQQNQAIEELQQAENDQQTINNQIEETKEQLIQCLASIDILNNQISDLENQIDETKINLIQAQELQQKEYSAMKKRIQYIYEEGGDAGWLVVLLQNQNISEVLNQPEYTQSIYKYDRECLEEYIQTVQSVNNYSNQLQQSQDELQESKSELENESNYLQELLSNLNLTSQQYEELINSLSNDIADYQNQIEIMNEELQAYMEQQRIIEEQEAIQIQIKEEQTEEIIQEENPVEEIQEDYVDEEQTYEEPIYEEEPAVEETYTPQSAGSATGQAIVNYALQFVGNPYVYGGNSLTNGIDCSGFTQQIYAAFGYSLPRSSAAQKSVGIEVSVNDLQPGDIICYYGHVAIYIGGTSIVHASNETVGIIVSDNFAYREIASIRRIV